MCGIVGYIGKNALRNAIEGLKSLEYRGYDSSGVGFFYNDKSEIIKSVGSINKLEEKINFNKYSNVNLAIGHTRWATHGNVLTKNAHPFESNNVILLHNGIIENYSELKNKLINEGYKFKSDVDSEVAAHLIDYYYTNNNYLEAINKACLELKGMYTFLILFKDNPKSIYAIKKDSPLFVGINNNEVVISSDLVGIVSYTNKYYTPLDNEIVEASLNEINIYNNSLVKIEKEINTCNLTKEAITKQGYKHYMLKEIYQQEEILEMIKKISIDHVKPIVKDINNIVIIGCGSAMHAGLVGKYLFEELLSIPTRVEIASEFRYSPFLYDKKSLFIFISQSGETADTIAALRLAKSYNVTTLGIVNVVGSTIANECDYLISLGIGNEIAVASTKAYYGQILYLYKLCFLIAKEKKINLSKIEKEFNNYKLKLDLENNNLKKVAKTISKKKDLFFIGRSLDYYLALEGSLKLKEITYIHSETYQAGELKHGPISLINNKSLVVAIMTKEELKSKTMSNIQEVISRKGKIILISDEIYNHENIINIKVDSFKSDCLSPLIIIPILQLISYYCAVYKKTNIDKPKNLAKSVTVE